MNQYAKHAPKLRKQLLEAIQANRTKRALSLFKRILVLADYAAGVK